MLSIRPALAIAVGAVVLLAAAPAQAGTTNVSWPVFIKVQAAPNTQNDIRVTYELFKGSNGSDWVHVVFDPAGVSTVVTEPPSCYPMSRAPGHAALEGKAVFCPDGSSPGEDDAGLAIPGQGEDFRILLGDQNDRFEARDSLGSFEVHGGPGNDNLVGQSAPIQVGDFGGAGDEECRYWSEDELTGDAGNDHLDGGKGPDHLTGGRGKDILIGGPAGTGNICTGFAGSDDALRGGPGNDVLMAADGDVDQVIDCGSGKHDKAFVDRRDPKPKGCEKVKAK
jgi:hypothetical protein